MSRRDEQPAALLRLRAIRRDVAERALGDARRATAAAVEQGDVRRNERAAAEAETAATHGALATDPTDVHLRLALLAKARADQATAAERVLAAERTEAEARFAEDEHRAKTVAMHRRHDGLATRVRDTARAEAAAFEEREMLELEHRRSR